MCVNFNGIKLNYTFKKTTKDLVMHRISRQESGEPALLLQVRNTETFLLCFFFHKGKGFPPDTLKHKSPRRGWKQVAIISKVSDHFYGEGEPSNSLTSRRIFRAISGQSRCCPC